MLFQQFRTSFFVAFAQFRSFLLTFESYHNLQPSALYFLFFMLIDIIKKVKKARFIIFISKGTDYDPNFSWDGKKILYSADTDDTHDNIFLVEVPKELL